MCGHGSCSNVVPPLRVANFLRDKFAHAHPWVLRAGVFGWIGAAQADRARNRVEKGGRSQAPVKRTTCPPKPCLKAINSPESILTPTLGIGIRFGTTADFIRDAPKIVGKAAMCLSPLDGCPLQSVIRHQVAPVVSGCAPHVPCLPAKCENGDRSQYLTSGARQ